MGKGEEFAKRTGVFKFKNTEVGANLLLELLRGPGNLMSGVGLALRGEDKAVEAAKGMGFIDITG